MSTIIAPVMRILTAGQIGCRVRVNRGHTLQQEIEATGRKQRNVNSSLVSSILSGGEGNEIEEAVLFKPNLFMTAGQLEGVYVSLRLYPAGPHLLCAINQADPVFADEHPNMVIFKNLDGKQCYIAFHNRYRGERVVDVGLIESYNHSLGCHWWYVGVAPNNPSPKGSR